MRTNITVFTEGFDYASDELERKLKGASVGSGIVNFIFDKRPCGDVLLRINDEIRKYPGISEVWLSFGNGLGKENINLMDFTDLSYVTYLNIGNFVIESFDGVQKFPLLNRISVGWTEVSNLDISPLMLCERLENLSFERKLSVRQHRILSELPLLKRLDVHGLNVSKVGVMPSLISLDVYGLREPELMAEKFPDLRELTIFSSNGVTDLDFVSGMDNLERLSVVGPMGGVTALPDFSRNKKLISLYLRDMKRLQCMNSLLTLPDLKELRLAGSIPMDAATVPWFKRIHFPGLELLRVELKSKSQSKELMSFFDL